MKETLKKVFDKSVLLVVGILFGCGIIFQYVVFPGLSASDTYLNILSALVGIFTILFIFHFIQWKDLFEFLSDKDEVIPPGETELDYIPKDEVVKKKKKTTKKKTEQHIVHPKVKTKKK